MLVLTAVWLGTQVLWDMTWCRQTIRDVMKQNDAFIFMGQSVLKNESVNTVWCNNPECRNL